MALVKRDEMPNITVEHLRTMCQGCIGNTLIEWAMVTPQCTHNFIQAVKLAMSKNNPWQCSEDTLMEELAGYPPTHEEFGVPDDMFTFNQVDEHHGDNTLKDWSLKIINRTTICGNCPTFAMA